MHGRMVSNTAGFLSRGASSILPTQLWSKTVSIGHNLPQLRIPVLGLQRVPNELTQTQKTVVFHLIHDAETALEEILPIPCPL